MDLSIIIVSFNTKDLLKKCLLSLSPKAEIIIVDNDSNDGTIEMLKEMKASCPALKIIFNQENRGFAKAVNQGLKQAKGEYLLLLNSDIFVKKNALDKLIAFAKDQHQAGVIGGRLLNPDGSPQGSCFYLPTLWRVIREFWLGKDNLSMMRKYFPIGKKPVEVEVVSGAVFLIPKRVLSKIGFFNERYFMYFEDLDYCRRVSQAGYKVYYLPEAEFIHAHGASGKNISSQTHKWLVESSQIYYGRLKYKLISLIIKAGQKWQKFGRNK
ncbi:glycosyltransferase family 2 protein [Patescibacteria group bacterium]|nr:glycosyltransferase family 2 protein [Patescibacteria group bacterium]